MQFPQKVTLLRKPHTATYLVKYVDQNAKNNLLDEKWYIGSSFDHNTGDVLRGLRTEEEKVLMKEIIGVEPNTLDWNRKVREYWGDIHRLVPTYGLDLQIGFTFDSEADFNEAKKNIVYDTRDKDKIDFIPLFKKGGYPINVKDYILYRYCLKYNRVARSLDYAYKSQHILFYIQDAELDEQLAITRFDNRKKAVEAFHAILGDIEKLKAIMLNYGEDISLVKPSLLPIEINKRLEADPDRFMQIIADKNLINKAIVQKFINASVLKILPGTTTYMFEDVVVGYSLDEALTNVDKNNSSSKALYEQMVYAYNKKRELQKTTA